MVDVDDRHILFESTAVRRINELVAGARIDELILRTNHATETVGLRRKNDALAAFAKVLKRTLDRDEAIHAILAVAREADRLEQLMAGRDEQ
jgi:hypothetical protein